MPMPGVLVKSSGGWRFLMSEVPLYGRRDVRWRAISPAAAPGYLPTQSQQLFGFRQSAMNGRLSTEALTGVCRNPRDAN